MKNINPLWLFDDHFLLEKLTKLGDPLKKLNEFIDWKIFESPINEAFKNEDRDLLRGGCPPFNRLILFKALDAAEVFANEGKMVDARWTKKNNATFYGYKNHVKADTRTKLIEKYIVTDASVHDCLRRYFVVTSYGTVADRERRGTAALCG